MRILELHIYGYGKLENFQINSINQLQVFYGKNEAGKSTIMSFVHSILFGFPAKQSSELRYEPKNHSKYGGQIKAFFPGRGIAVIERVKGKSAGDVTVSIEDGTIGGEDLLKELMQSMDKSIFQAIFSFNVHGLQNIHSMKGEELGRYLFSAGTLGTDKLFTAENTLIKEMELRFKPSGKKPLLNEKLKELKEVQTSLKNAEQQNARYTELIQEKEAIEERIRQLKNDMVQLEQAGTKLREYKRNGPLVIEEAAIQQKLAQLGDVAFPEDGLLRYEKIEQQLKPIQARLSWIQDKRESLMEEVDLSKPDEHLLQKETEIDSILGNLPLYDQLKQEKRLLDLKIEELTEEIALLNDQLHSDFKEDTIQKLNTSMFMKEEAESIQHLEQRLNDKRQELEAGFDEEKTALVELKSKAAEARKGLLPDDRRVQLSEELTILENKQQLQSELNQVRDQILLHKDRIKNEEIRRANQSKKDFYQLLLLGGIFMVVALLGITNSQWLLAAAGILGILFLLAIHFKSARGKSPAAGDKILASLLERERSLKGKLDIQPEGSHFTIKSLLARDDELQLRHRELLIQIEHQQERYEKVLKQFEKWELEDAELKEKKAALMAELGLTEKVNNTRIFDAYQIIEQLKQYFRERKRTVDKLGSICRTIEEMEGSLYILAERFLQPGNMPPAEAAALLKRKLRDAIDLKAKSEELAIKLREMDEEYSSLQKEQQLLLIEREDLLAQADSKDEEGFRLQAKNHEQMRIWSSRLADLSSQLDVSGITTDDRNRILAEPALEDKLNEYKTQEEQSRQELTGQFDRLASVKHSMKMLEEGGMYSELLHRYKQLKHEFEEDSKEWAKYAIAKDLLTRTINRYKEERMPRMLSKAEQFLSVLTEGRYVRIIPHQSESGFWIERNDHILFEANELSQATAEQVYASIRLALASVHYDRYPFPIIIDDSFVNFDHQRTERMIRLLREMGSNQILFFTCHRHLLDHFENAEIVKLEEKSTNIV
jgi:uncharacterized protein YhaN